MASIMALVQACELSGRRSSLNPGTAFQRVDLPATVGAITPAVTLYSLSRDKAICVHLQPDETNREQDLHGPIISILLITEGIISADFKSHALS